MATRAPQETAGPGGFMKVGGRTSWRRRVSSVDAAEKLR